MNISLKTLVIFCLVAATTVLNVTSSTTNTPTSTPNAITVTTEDVTSSTTNTPTSTPNAITVTTEAPGETSTGMFNTDTTTASTDDTPVSTIPTTTTTTTQGPCASSPCIGDSICEERFGSLFVCTCRQGLFYLEMRGCIRTKVFPGDLSLDREFQKEMNNAGSESFLIVARGIEEALRRILGGDNGYINSTVLRLRPGSIIAEVQNFYELSSNATSESVSRTIVEGSAGIANFTKFETRSPCNTGFCDSTTTECNENEPGISMCTCKQEYIRSQSTSQACLACPNGEKATNNSESCKKCPFGFSGFNCSDPYLLVVIVVSSVLGALLIIVIVALIVVNCRNQKGSSSSHVDYSSIYDNKKLQKPTGVSRIPRANPDANKLEMTDSGKNQRYTDYDEDMSNRGRIPPPYSGYSGRGVENGGVHNPYFQHDDDRMRRN